MARKKSTQAVRLSHHIIISLDDRQQASNSHHVHLDSWRCRASAPSYRQRDDWLCTAMQPVLTSMSISTRTERNGTNNFHYFFVTYVWATTSAGRPRTAQGRDRRRRNHRRDERASSTLYTQTTRHVLDTKRRSAVVAATMVTRTQIKITHQTKCNFSTTLWDFYTKISWFIWERYCYNFEIKKKNILVFSKVMAI